MADYLIWKNSLAGLVLLEAQSISSSSFTFLSIYSLKFKIQERGHRSKGIGHLRGQRSNLTKNAPIELKTAVTCRKLANLLLQILHGLWPKSMSSSFFLKILVTEDVKHYSSKMLLAISTKLGQKNHWPKLPKGCPQIWGQRSFEVTRGHLVKNYGTPLNDSFSLMEQATVSQQNS